MRFLIFFTFIILSSSLFFSKLSRADQYNATIVACGSNRGCGPETDLSSFCARWGTLPQYCTASFGYFLSQSGCAGGGIYSGSWAGKSDQCINAPSCTAGTVRAQDGICKLPTCPSGQYYNIPSLACTAIPNCNASNPSSGNYFDTTTGACRTLTTCDPNNCTVKECAPPPVGKPTKYYCPTTDNCKTASDICTTDLASVASENSTRTATVTAAKAAADKAASDAASAKQSATDAAAAKAAKAASDKAAANAAASQSSNPALPTAAQQAATDAAASAAVAASNSSAASTNSAAAAASAAASAAAASTSASKIIPATTNQGNSETYRDQAVNSLTDAVNSLSDAIAGRGTVAGVGEVGGTGQQQTKITCEDTKTCPSTGSISTSTDTGFSDATTASIAIAQASVKSAISAVKTESASMFSIAGTAGGQLPVYDFGTIKGQHVVVDFNKFTNFFTIASSAVYMLAVMISISIFMS